MCQYLRAGNLGPDEPSDDSPANNPDAFSVGAVGNTDVIASFSSHGPTSCGRDSPETFPDVVAPGVAITTTDLYGLYQTASGTSFAAPHVTGAVALLLSAFPWMSVDELRTALTTTAVDLGTVGPDNTFGAGWIDVLAAYTWAASISTPTATNSPTPTDTATETATPTDTPTATDTSTATDTATATHTAMPTDTPTNTPSATLTMTSSATALSTQTATPTQTIFGAATRIYLPLVANIDLAPLPHQ